MKKWKKIILILLSIISGITILILFINYCTSPKYPELLKRESSYNSPLNIENYKNYNYSAYTASNELTHKF